MDWVKTYVSILRVPHALRIFLAVIAVRAGTSGVDFSMLWVIKESTGSFAYAGFALALSLFGTAIGNPIQGRISDRYGLKISLSVTGIGFLFLAAVLVVSSLLAAPLWVIFPLSFIMGLSRPAGQGFGRASWAILYSEEEQRLQAASLDSIQSGIVNGSATASAVVLSQIIAPGLVLISFALVAALGAFLLAFSPVAKLLHSEQKSSEESDNGIYKIRKLRLLFSVQFFFFISDGALVVGLITLAAAWNKPALGGVFIAFLFAGLIVGALKFGLKGTENFNHLNSMGKALTRYFLGLVLCSIVVLFLFWWLILPALFISGYQRGGFTPSVQLMIHDISPLSRLNEALAFIYVALIAGAGLGRAVSGIASESIAASPILLSTLSVGLACLSWLLLKRSFTLNQQN